MITPFEKTAWLTRFVLPVALVLFTGCTSKASPDAPQWHQLGLGEELVPPNEKVLIDKIIAVHADIQYHVDRELTPIPRGQHPKQHGCVAAEFIVEPNLPSNLRHGIFETPKTYPALVRFSNARQYDDRLPDAHGMAVKLTDVEGEIYSDDSPGTQDFVMIDNPTMFVRDVEESLQLLKDFRSVAMGGFLSRAWSALKFVLSPSRKFRLLREAGSKRPDNPLSIQYWSTTSSKLGPTAMKFTAKPNLDGMPVEAETDSKDKLRLAMSASLRKQGAYFDFLVQPQTDPVRMPVEDPTIAWDESLSTPIKVATILIPMQAFESDEQMKACENSFFSPWNTLAAHRPLGGVNRSRKKLYEILSRRRHEMNGISEQAP